MVLKKNDVIGGSYVVDKIISNNGGTATIYLCHSNVNSDKQVVVKMSKNGTDQANHEGKLLEREAKLLSSWSFRHPGIVRVYPVISDSARKLPYYLKDITRLERPSFMVMEYLRGGALSTPENKKLLKTLPVEWKMECFYQVVVAIASLHAKGYGHRDLKPDNICLRSPIDKHIAPDPVLIDFALTSDGKDYHDDIVDKAMTLEYSPPERLIRSMGAKFDNLISEDPLKSDIYALGIILYELIIGEYPFKGNKDQIRTTILHKEINTDKIGNQNHDYASEMAQMIRGMAQKEPHKRPRIDQIIKTIEGVFRPPLI